MPLFFDLFLQSVEFWILTNDVITLMIVSLITHLLLFIYSLLACNGKICAIIYCTLETLIRHVFFSTFNKIKYPLSYILNKIKCPLCGHCTVLHYPTVITDGFTRNRTDV